jgi:hypothetical protein
LIVVAGVKAAVAIGSRGLQQFSYTPSAIGDASDKL